MADCTKTAFPQSDKNFHKLSSQGLRSKLTERETRYFQQSKTRRQRVIPVANVVAHRGLVHHVVVKSELRLDLTPSTNVAKTKLYKALYELLRTTSSISFLATV